MSSDWLKAVSLSVTLQSEWIFWWVRLFELNYFVSGSLICCFDRSDEVCLNISRDLAHIPICLYNFPPIVGIILSLIPLFAVWAEAWSECIAIQIKLEMKFWCHFYTTSKRREAVEGGWVPWVSLIAFDFDTSVVINLYLQHLVSFVNTAECCHAIGSGEGRLRIRQKDIILLMKRNVKILLSPKWKTGKISQL